MIINSQMYNGKCSCGREHKMTTEMCIIEKGALGRFGEYAQKYGLGGKCAAIYDKNTYAAAGKSRPRADAEIIFDPYHLHADNAAVAKALAEIPEDCEYLIAVGSGTIHDITRYCANEKGIPFAACPTAASVDGFCSSVAAMTWHDFKKTFPAIPPKIVIADLDIISKAPIFLTNSGIADLLGKFIALADWKIGHILTNEYFCPVIYKITMDATRDIAENAEKLKKGNTEAYEKLIYGLLMSGLAMQMLGNSRCASGAEHHISHLIEMQPEPLGINSDALHGEKVGVGTLMASAEYHRIRNDKDFIANDYRVADEEYVKNLFGENLCGMIMEENAVDCAKGITKKLIDEKWDEICAVIDEIPTKEELMKIYSSLGLKSTLSDIDVPEEKADILMEYSPLVRNRLTGMRIRRMADI